MDDSGTFWQPLVLTFPGRCSRRIFCGCGFFLALLPVLRSYALIAAVSACINWPRADPLS